MRKKEPRRRRSVEQTIALIADLETKIERQARKQRKAGSLLASAGPKPAKGRTSRRGRRP